MDPGTSAIQHGSTRRGVLRGESFILSHEQGHADYEFGGKTIGLFAGVALLINNITGPGVPGIPNMFAEAGWVSPTFFFILIWLMSTVSATMYAEAMRRIPGNEHFRGRLEYTSIVDYYFGRWGYLAAQIGLNGALQSLNIISVIQSAQVMDQAIAAVAHRSCGFNISPFRTDDVNGTLIAHSTDAWSCLDLDQLGASTPYTPNPWGCHVVITAGYVMTLAMAIPCGIFNLDDNMIVQVVAFILTLMCWLVWIGAAFIANPPGGWHLDAVNTNPVTGSQAGVLGTILFNFGFVTTVPSWVNEKKPSVSVNKTLWLSTFLCNVIFFVIGIPGAMAFRDILQGPATNTCLQGASDDDGGQCYNGLMSVYTSNDPNAHIDKLFNSKATSFILQLSVYLFPIVAIVSSIPVFSIVIKYNCVENGWSRKSAFLWGVVFPWVAALPLLYQPNALSQFINFSSLFFVSFTDFVVPWTLYIMMVRAEGRWGRRPTQVYDSTKLNSVAEEEEEDDGTAFSNDSPSRRSRAGSSANEETSLLRRKNNAVLEHFAIPPSWGVSSQSKIYVSAFLVLLMTGLSIGGVVLTIQQSLTTTWVCWSVGGS